MDPQKIHNKRIWIWILCIFIGFDVLCQSRPPLTKALVIGISNYQDPAIPNLPFANRDAEYFASFIKSNRRNLETRDLLMLYTDKQASLAGLSTGLDWLTEDAQKGDTLILFFAGYASFSQADPVNGNSLYFFDSPPERNTSMSFNLFAQFKILAKRKKAVFHCIGNLYPALFDRKENYTDSILPLKRKTEKPLFKNLVQINRVRDKSDSQLRIEAQESKHSLTSYLFKGLMGLADDNADKKVSLKELGSYFDRLAVFPWIQPGNLFVASSMDKGILSHVSSTNLSALDEMEFSTISPVVSLETSKREREDIQRLSERNRSLYEDFILSIRLGNLLGSPAKNASSIYDTLSKEHEMRKFLSTMQRKLAAALQDETQQVLNAYLNVDSKELINRISGNVNYDVYARYLDKAIELLGGPHYMTKILKAKKLYFESVQKRIRGQREFNKGLISEAINLLNEALALENQASFLYNEIGINYILFGRKEEAIKSFLSAIEYSPTWSIPFSNLAQLYATEDINKALRIAKHAIRLSPQNSFAWYIEGSLQLRLNNYQTAESSLLKALKIDPGYAVANYNLACALSLQKKTEEAYEKLELAIRSGIATYEAIQNDLDLAPLRTYSLRWNDLMKRYFVVK